jgi:hypothetical protein
MDSALFPIHPDFLADFNELIEYPMPRESSGFGDLDLKTPINRVDFTRILHKLLQSFFWIHPPLPPKNKYPNLHPEDSLRNFHGEVRT